MSDAVINIKNVQGLDKRNSDESKSILVTIVLINMTLNLVRQIKTCD